MAAPVKVTARQSVSPALAGHKWPQFFFDICRAMSLYPLTYGIACCAIEMMSTAMARFDLARFGSEVFRPSPRQADLLIVAGTVNRKMAPVLIRLYEQMPAPKWVMALGNCTLSGGPFLFQDQYAVIEGIDRLVPVDVYVPGCPPRPEALMEGLFQIQKKITGRRWWPLPEDPNRLAAGEPSLDAADQTASKEGGQNAAATDGGGSR